MMKHILKCSIAFFAMLFIYSTNISAAPSVNGNGANGSATSRCNDGYPVCWYRVQNPYDNAIVNDDGVRLTLLKLDTNGNPIDFIGQVDYSNYPHNGENYFTLESGTEEQKKSINKLFYNLYSYNLKLDRTSGYVHNIPSSPIPWVVRASDGKNNMAAVKQWFSTAEAIQGIAKDFGMTCTDATKKDACEIVQTYDNGVGKYKILLEPIAYVQLKQIDQYYNVAITPTQMAMYDTRYADRFFYNGARTMLYDTFAKGMFLESNDLGFRAYTPSSGAQSIQTVKQYLGLAVISFGSNLVEADSPIENPVVTGDNSSATYRYNTNVFTSTTLDANVDRTASNPVQFKMTLASTGQTLCSDQIQIPKNQSQLAYCSWKTPAPSSRTSDKVYVYADGSIVSTINISYQNIWANEPPDPTADDTIPAYNWSPQTLSLTNLNSGLTMYNTWDVWYSENNHKDGTDKSLSPLKTTFSNLGTNAVATYTRNYSRSVTWHSGTSAYCSVSSAKNSTDCAKANGTWHRATAGYYSCGSWTYSENEVLTSNTADYKFYKYKDYGYSKSSTNLTISLPACSTGRSSYSTSMQTTFVSNDDTSKPYKDTFMVSLTSVNSDITSDPNGDPYGSDSSMSSGYGIITNNSASYTTRVVSHGFGSGSSKTPIHTAIQNVLVQFPEFDYRTYYRVLDMTSGSNTVNSSSSGTFKYQFAKNRFDIGNERTHFTPVWFPNNKNYSVLFRYYDFWTPKGMLQAYDSDSIKINGSVFDDYHVVFDR